MQTLKTFSPLIASYSIALSRRSSNPNALTKPNFFAAYAAPIVVFLQSASIGSILYAISSTRRKCNISSKERVELFEIGEQRAVEGGAVPVLPESISETIVRGRIKERDHQVGPFLIGQVRVV
jgi:hypothetical protein